MANTNNVKFYKVSALPLWESKYTGIFVHIDGEYDWTKGATDLELDGGKYKVFKYGLKDKSGLFWINDREYPKEHVDYKFRAEEDTVKGLWFGGKYGWELLSNVDTLDDSAINALIKSWIDNNIVNNSYSSANDWVDRRINTKIGNLNANTVATLVKGTPDSNNSITLTLKGVKEDNGIIAQGEGTDTFTVGNAKLYIGQESVFSANATTDSKITLGSGLTFTKGDNTLKLGLILGDKIEVTTDNPLVTRSEINSLAGAMHYKGAVSKADDLPKDGNNVTAGDVYIATEGFQYTFNGKTVDIEAGDMIVFDGKGGFSVIQSNITLGIGGGQVAANDGALSRNEIVIATGNGIKTSGYTLDTASSRTLTVGSVGTETGGAIHEAKATDTLSILGQNRNASLTIKSSNDSIDVRGSNTNNDGIITLDLVWNTVLA